MPFETLNQVIQDADKFPHEFDPKNPDEVHHTIPFRMHPHIVGRVLPSVVARLIEYNQAQSTPPFEIVEGSHVSFAYWVNNFDQRTQVMKDLLDTWREMKTFNVLAGWRNEKFPVFGDATREDNTAFVVERAGAPLFGISQFGAHLNAFVRDTDGSIKMWVARRSRTKQTWPGMLDNCVAGGVAWQQTTRETIVRECNEEASIPHEIAEQARNAGAVTYFTYTHHGLVPETQYVYDLQLPLGVTPTPQDGEVECFYLWSLDQVRETLLNGEWKPNCALVMIDFLMRHSIITADTEPDYIDLTYRLHRRLEFPTPRKQIITGKPLTAPAPFAAATANANVNANTSTNTTAASTATVL
ncbi:NUDIX hydrolase domain-like protein [Syncephalastrum racemosum]|uniref:NUDIX hydrolase domain-like protein n=1 Tax=Syncephalastrum racemosum TaxID=13706 RepID=A0A1X2H653_SYNRA|nr:NUDIX hydrolase domain-like protein [Syncephalastrum racemosum]